MSVQDTKAILPYVYTRFGNRDIIIPQNAVEEIIFMIGTLPQDYVCGTCAALPVESRPIFRCDHWKMECNEMAMKITTFALAVYRKTEQFPLFVQGAIHAFIQIGDSDLPNDPDELMRYPDEIITIQSFNAQFNIPVLYCHTSWSSPEVSRKFFTENIITLASREPENAERMVAKILSLLEQLPNAYVCDDCRELGRLVPIYAGMRDCFHWEYECSDIAMTMCHFALDTFGKTEDFPLFVKAAIYSFHANPEALKFQAYDLSSWPEGIMLKNAMTLTFVQKYNELMIKYKKKEETRKNEVGMASLTTKQLQEKEWNRDLTAEDEEADQVVQWGGYVNQLQRPMLQTSNRSTRELNLLSVAMRRNYEAPSIDIEPVTSTVFYGTVNSPSQPAGGTIVTPTSGESTISGNAPAS